MAPHSESAHAPRPLLAFACWGGLLLLYETLAASPGWPEAAAGALASLLATAAVLASGSPEHLGQMSWGWWFLLMRRLPLRVLGGTVRVLAATVGVEVPRGRPRSLRFEAGGADPVSASRRALVIAGASLAPNSYVIGVDPEASTLLTHQLVPKDPAPGQGDPLWPI
jgi:hypothetical protein